RGGRARAAADRGVIIQSGAHSRGGRSRMASFGPPRWAAIAGITALYILAGKLGLQLAFVNASATAVWPATGIALAALLLVGPRAWIAVAAGAFVVNVTTSGTIGTSLAIAAGNTLEGLLGAWLVGRFASGTRAFDRVRDVLAFVAAIVPGVAVSATVGGGSLVLGGQARGAGAGPVWVTWALGDGAGALVGTPPLICWAADRRLALLRQRWIEAGGLLVSLIAVGLVVFAGASPAGWQHAPLAFLSIPFLVWAAFRFGRREATVAVVVLSVVALYGTLGGL